MHSLVVTAGNTMYNLRDGLTFDPQVFGLNTSLFGESFSTLEASCYSSEKCKRLPTIVKMFNSREGGDATDFVDGGA